MTLTNESKSFMEYFDLFEPFFIKKKHNNKVLKKLYKSYKKAIHLYKTKYKQLIKKSVFEKRSKNVNDLLSGPYISEDCKKQIDESRGTLNVNLNILGVDVNFEYLIFNNKHFNKLNIYDSYIEKSITFLIFLFGFIQNKKPSSIHYYLYLTKYKKLLPKNKKDILCGTNCNTGVTYGCAKNGKVLIYREEEWFKVFIHETFHMLCLDFNSMYLDNFNNKFRSIINIHSDYNLFETYTEFWATYLNCVYCATKLGDNEKDFLNIFDFCINYESSFSLYQCIKVLKHMGLTFENLTSKDEISKSLKTLYYKENTNVFAYYILKAIVLYNKSTFIHWCLKNNSNMFNFTKTDINLNNFLDYLNYILNSNLLKVMMKNIEKTYSLIKSKTLKRTLRMAIININ